MEVDVTESALSKRSKQLKIIEVLSTGSFSNTFRVMHALSGDEFAIKRIALPNKINVSKMLREVKLLGKIDSKFVVRYYKSWLENLDSTSNPEEETLPNPSEMCFLFIQMELCDGDLESWLTSVYRNLISSEQLRNMFIQITNGLAWIHRQNVIHRDLKPSKIFFKETSDERFIWKIGDFGLNIGQNQTDFKPENFQYSSNVYKYYSPEMAKNQSYSNKTDVYSLGLIFLEILVHPYFKEKELFKEYTEIRNNVPQSESIIEHWIVPKYLSVIITQMLNQDAGGRPSTGNIIQMLNAPDSCVPMGPIRTEYVYNPPPESKRSKITTIQNVSDPEDIRADFYNFKHFGIKNTVSNFVGRTKEFDILQQTFIEKPNHTVLITGFGGIGKTQLVRKFFADTEHSNFVKIWLDCAGTENLLSNFEELTSLMGLSFDSTDILTVSKLILESFNRQISSKQFLIVFDGINNSNSNKTIQDIIQLFCLNKHTFVIVTSRNFDSFTSDHLKLELTELRHKDAIELVLRTIGECANEKDVTALCNVLGNYPLAIQQAISYILEQQKARGKSYQISDYIFDLETNISELLGKPNQKYRHAFPDLCNKTTLSIWDDILENLPNEFGSVGRNAIEILKILAYLEPNEVRLNFVRNFFRDLMIYQGNFHLSTLYTQSQFNHAIELLSSLSLLTINGNSIRVNQLTLLMIRNKIKHSTNFLVGLLECLNNTYTTHG